MYSSTTTTESKLGDGPKQYLETAATTTIDRMTVRGNGIKIG